VLLFVNKSNANVPEITNKGGLEERKEKKRKEGVSGNWLL
jgi:hypothetical protein